ncbi:MAG TPA: sugar ABC transporter permease [Solirubrobacteraceae bacterium]|nr:sugar ABC transporter permease [Solirubrobacteraceae bacterium]
MRSARWLLAPYVTGAVVLLAVPAIATFVVAFFEFDLLGTSEWIGLENFRELVDDPIVREAIVNSLTFAGLAVPLRLLGALGLALLLHERFRGAGAARTAAYLPTVVPDVAYALLWLFLVNPLFGPINALLGAVGLPEPDWLTTGAGAMAAIVLMSGFTIGEGFVVALAARQELPKELYELARVEGSGPLHTFRRVTLPLMAPTLSLLAIRDLAFSLQVSFVPAYLMTDGGPDRDTLFLPLYAFDVGFEQLRYGYAAAMTLTMFLITALLVLVQLRLVRRWRFGATV